MRPASQVVISLLVLLFAAIVQGGPAEDARAWCESTRAKSDLKFTIMQEERAGALVHKGTAYDAYHNNYYQMTWQRRFEVMDLLTAGNNKVTEGDGYDTSGSQTYGQGVIYQDYGAAAYAAGDMSAAAVYYELGGQKFQSAGSSYDLARSRYVEAIGKYWLAIELIYAS